MEGVDLSQRRSDVAGLLVEGTRRADARRQLGTLFRVTRCVVGIFGARAIRMSAHTADGAEDQEHQRRAPAG